MRESGVRVEPANKVARVRRAPSARGLPLTQRLTLSCARAARAVATRVSDCPVDRRERRTSDDGDDGDDDDADGERRAAALARAMSAASAKTNVFSYDALVHAISGAAGSVVAMATFYPLDTVRSRLQLEEERESKNTVAMIQELVSKEGLYTLYRGMVPVLQSLCASNFVYFYTFHGLKTLRSAKNQNAANDLLVASIAGAINVLVTTPLWVVNTRLKMRGIKGKKNEAYVGLSDGLFYIWKHEGISKLWAGTLPSLILVVNPVIQFVVYESIKRRVLSRSLSSQPSDWTFFAIGALAKTVATVITYPLQLVQNKLRHGSSCPELPPNAGTLRMLLHIFKKQGLRGIYKGMEAKLLQTVLTAALMFLAYEKISRLVFHILAGGETVGIKRIR